LTTAKVNSSGCQCGARAQAVIFQRLCCSNWNVHN